jgi:hypothetical protein
MNNAQLPCGHDRAQLEEFAVTIMGIETGNTVKLCAACHARSIEAPPPVFPEPPRRLDAVERTGSPPAASSALTDDDSLQGAFSRFGRPLRVWDDGFGPLWVVRASTWEEAHSCVVDEIMDDADVSDPDNQPDEHGNLPEGLSWRGSGVPSQEGLESPLAAEDLNGSALDALTDALADELEIRLEIEGEDPEIS